MLILTRRVGETLMIGDEVSVTVLGVKGNQVRLGVNAPKDIAVHREEIYQRILHEKGYVTGHEAGYEKPQEGGFDPRQYSQNPQDYGQASQGFGRNDRLNPDRRPLRASQFGLSHNATTRNYGTSYAERPTNKSMNHLENPSFATTGIDTPQKTASFNPNFDPFDEDYYNR